jgi:hypothetical protein
LIPFLAHLKDLYGGTDVFLNQQHIAKKKNKK